MKLGDKANLLVAILLGFELLFAGALYALLQQAETDARRINESRAIVTGVNRLMRTIVSLSLRMRSLTLSSEPETHAMVRRMYSELYDLEKACQGRPRELQAIQNVRATVDDGMAEFARAQQMIKSKQWNEVKNFPDKIRPMLSDMADRFEEIRKDQETIELFSYGQQEKQRMQIKNFLLAGLGFNVFLAFVLVSLFNKSIASRLRHLMKNTQRLSVGEVLEPPIPGDDEIAHLDKTFNEVATALTTAMNKQNAIFQHALEVICSLKEDDRFSEVSSSALRVFGYTPEELARMRLYDILVADEVDVVKDVLRQLRNGTPAIEFESKVRKKDGPIITVHFSAHWSQEKKGTRSDAPLIFLVALDITERKLKEDILEEAETRLRNIIESLPIGLLMINLRGVIKLTNPVVEKMFSATGGHLLDRPIDELISIPGQSEPLKFVQRCKGKSLETPIVMAGENSLTVEMSAREIDTNEGKRLLILIVDVSERAAVEQMKQQFVAMVSHELKTPLMAVQLYLELLTRGTYGTLNEAGAEKMKAVDENLTRLTRLIKDLLDVERLEAGTLSSSKRPIQLQEVFKTTEESVHPAAEKRKIEVVFPEVDIDLKADQDRLVQVLVNLIANAIKFSPEGSVIKVEAEANQETVTVAVRDQGRGVPKEFQEKIFERFQQVSLEDASSKGGAGLGLAICKSIVQQHGGTISVESEQGQGSRFWFQIPRN